MKNLKNALLLVFISGILIFVVLEAGLRISGKYGNLPYSIKKGDFNFEWGWEMPTNYFSFEPNSKVKIDCIEFTYEYDINSLGVREREVDVSDTSAMRLFIYGDSFVEGNGAAYDSTWPRRIEELLVHDGTYADVYTTGVSSSDPFYAFSALRDKLLDLGPTHFIVAINDSDYDDYLIRGGFSRFQSGGKTQYRKPPGIYPFYRNSHLVRMVAHQFLGYDHKLIRNCDGIENRREASDSLMNALDLINGLCRENGIEFMAVIHPTPHQVCNESPGYNTDVLSIDPSSWDFPAVYLYEPLKGILNGENCYDYAWRIDSHFNGRGYQMFGDLVYHEIQTHYPDYFTD